MVAFATTCLIVLIGCGSAAAQQKKGDKEVRFFSGGFFFNFGGDSRFVDSFGNNVSFSSTSQGFEIGATVGYFATRRHEVGGGTHFSAFHTRSCTRTLFGDQFSEFCNSNADVGLGLIGFYRYNFARETSKRFPFVAIQVSVNDVTGNFTGNVSAFPHAGYKYFLKGNVAVDFTVGYVIQVNKVRDSFFDRDRLNTIAGNFGLTFIF
jgi:hypothetical protein